MGGVGSGGDGGGTARRLTRVWRLWTGGGNGGNGGDPGGDGGEGGDGGDEGGDGELGGGNGGGGGGSRAVERSARIWSSTEAERDRRATTDKAANKTKSHSRTHDVVAAGGRELEKWVPMRARVSRACLRGDLSLARHSTAEGCIYPGPHRTFLMSDHRFSSIYSDIHAFF